MCIEDDGRGFDVARADQKDRNGLRNMRARLAEIGGAIDIESEPGHTVVRISMPLSAATPGSPMPATTH
jgi:two-component system NarL family sensor kinase